jgi:acyl carrier protein
MSTEERVFEVIAEVFEIPTEELSASLRFADDLGATSLDVVTLVWRIEEAFGLGEIEESALESVHTLGDLIELVDARRGSVSEAVEVVDVAIAADHAGVNLKADLVDWLTARGCEVRDLGPADAQSVDYPDFASRVANQVKKKVARKGILVCGSGIGMSIAANKVDGVRAAVVCNPLQARLARQHNNLNVLCLGERLIGSDMARECVAAFLDTPFDPGDDGRHRRRVGRIHELEHPERRD